MVSSVAPARANRRLRVLVLTHQPYEPDADTPVSPESKQAATRTERDVIAALDSLGHEVRLLAGAMQLTRVRDVVTKWKPHVAFNLLEEFEGEGIYVPFVLGYLELMRVPFTGCNPAGLLVADSKQLMKKVLRYHRIPAPEFALFPRGRKVRRPRKLNFPLIVKSATAHGSAGISQASLVTSDEKLRERVSFVHDHVQTDALAEEYIEGRELYAGVLGNARLDTFPVWELVWNNPANGAPRIATEKVKWDETYQKRRGIDTGPARNLDDAIQQRIVRLCKKVYRILGLSGYARMDFRLADDGRLVLLEPNPNPDLARDEDFATSAASANVAYETLVQRILALGIRYFGGRPAARGGRPAARGG